MSNFSDSAELGAIVMKLVQRNLGRQTATVQTHARQGNNCEVIHIQLEHSDRTVAIPPQPGCVPLDPQTLEIILKFQALDVGLDESVRLMNEVAAIDLARCELRTLNVVPNVFAYGKIEHSSQALGWIIESFKPGELLASAWDELPSSDKETLLTQMARIYVALQKCRLPDTVDGFGGLQYSKTGVMISGPIVFGFGGPYANFDEMYIGMFKRQIELADSCPVVKGWSGSKKGLRKCLESFVDEGLPSCLAAITNKTPTLTHGDFDLFNLLFDKSSMTITALLDFDFAHIASPIDEYLYSFQLLSSLLVGAHAKGDMGKLQRYLLTGERPARLPPNNRTIDWNVAVTWNEAIKAAGGIRPSDVEGADVLAELKWLMEDIRPPYFAMPRWLAKRTSEEIETQRKKVEADLGKRLKRLGYLGGKAVTV